MDLAEGGDDAGRGRGGGAVQHVRLAACCLSVAGCWLLLSNSQLVTLLISSNLLVCRSSALSKVLVHLQALAEEPQPQPLPQQLRANAIEELTGARALLDKHRGDDERTVKRARIWFARQSEDVQGPTDEYERNNRRRRVDPAEVDGALVDVIIGVFERKGAVSAAQANALRKLSGLDLK